MKTYICKGCGTEHPRRGIQFKNLYCSNKCQKDYESRQRVKQWLDEGRDWTGQIPGWAKRTLAEQRGYKCEICNTSEWQGKLLSLECDHVDGNHKNNNITNLRLICPNCHSLTDTYKAKNKGNARASRRKEVNT
jgi:hypothetical protein